MARRIEKFVKNPVETCLGVISISLCYRVELLHILEKARFTLLLVDPVKANITIKARGNYSALETKEIIVQIEERFLNTEGVGSVYLESRN